LQILDSSSNDAELTEITKHDLRQNIYQIQGNLTDAFEEMKKRAWCSDSLMANLQLHNLQDMATEAQLVKTQKDAAANRMRMMTIILLLAAALIILLAVFNYLRQKSRQNLAEKNEQLKHALSMAEESDKMKTEFVRSVSHEIRTPLNAIMGFADVITTPGLELPEVDRQDLINRINDNTKAITRIVDDMLHASELSSTDYYANEDSILLNQFLSQELYSYRDKVTSKIELIYTTSIINRFTLNSNKKGLEQILTHLIDNAVKFTQSGTIELNCRQSNRGEIVISLTDTGCGIAKDQQEKIFENFYKVDYFQQGIGLGLSVSKKIAQKLGGDLTLDPDYTNGTRFVLTLPIS
jgi:signal transduction histidine kinase